MYHQRRIEQLLHVESSNDMPLLLSQLNNSVKINILTIFDIKTTDSQCFFVFLQATFIRLSRHIRKRRALLILALYSQILAKFEYRNRQVATTLTLRIYTIPKGITIYSLCVSGCCLLISVGNARSLTVE